VLSFHNGLENDFIFDDSHAIVNNTDVDADSPWYPILENDIWGKNLQMHDSHRSFRPLLVATFKALTIAFGKTPYYFRVFSILLHVVASNLVYTLASVVYRNRYLALGSALLFACHPIHVESVTAVVNLAEAASSIFYMSAYVLYVVSTDRPRSLSSSLLHAATALILTIISALFKETGVTVSGIIVSRAGVNLTLSLVRSVRVGTGGGGRWRHWNDCLWRETPWIALAFIIVIMYFLFRIALISTSQLWDTMYSIATLDIRKALTTISSSYLGDSAIIRKVSGT
jgi:hypothetical protein